MKPIAVFTTTATRDEADAIAAALVERRLAACVQISSIDSVYVWQGTTRSEPEVRLMIKTTDLRYAEVEALIRELHPYDLPAIYAIPLAQVFEPYADWVAENSDGD